MTITAESFIQKLYSLEGTTIAQRKKNFFTLLHQNASLKNDEELLETISTDLHPRNFLEELFKLEFLIYFRRRKELYQLLTEGNDIFVSKITKQQWFFQDIFKEKAAEDLVNDILPTMSYSVRMKVLKKLSRSLNHDQFDKIFDAVKSRYGVFIARQFITGCSPDKIREFVRLYKVNLTQVQLIILYRKDPNLIEFYLTHVDSAPYQYNYVKLLKFLYIEDLKLYNHLKEKFHFECINLGRRLTKKIIVVKRDEVICKPQYFFYLYMKVVIRKIGKDAVQLFCNSLPVFKDLYCVVDLHFLNYFAYKYHYNLIFNVIPNHYNIKYLDHPRLITSELLELEPDKEKRSVLAKVRVDEGKEEFIRYLSSEQSIPLLKEKINVTSDMYKRQTLLRYLLDTCVVNKDLNALEQVLKYFVKRHINDDRSIFWEFLRDLDSRCNYRDFTEDMWNLYFEILIMYTLKHEADLEKRKNIQSNPLRTKLCFGISVDRRLEYLEWLFRANKLTDESLKEYFFYDFSYHSEWGTYDKDFEMYILKYIISNISKQKFENRDDELRSYCDLIDKIFSWNEHYPNDKVSFDNYYSFLSDAFNYALRSNNCFVNRFKHIWKFFRSKIFTTTDNENTNEYLQIYWEGLLYYKEKKDFDWFLKYDPKIIEKNFEAFLGRLFDESIGNFGRPRRFPRRKGFASRFTHYHSHQLNMWYRLKKFSHLNFDEKAIEYCKSKINDVEDKNYKPQYVCCLSVLLKPEDFAAMADTYKPENKKLDLQNEKEVKLFNLQCAIGENFKNTKSHSVLPSLFNYCAGDYFHHSLRSLYSILYKTPENKLSTHLTYLAKKAVSVRKHALYFTCELTTVEQVENMLTLLNKSEGVLSLQKYLFSATIKYFLKNPFDKFFEIVKSNLLFITKDDDESHKLIVEKCSSIPIEYRSSYIQHSWEHFEKIVEIQQDLQRLKNGLVSEMSDTEVMKTLSLEFVIKVIRQHFLTKDKLLVLYDIRDFAFTFLTSRDEKSAILDVILDKINHCDCKEEVSKLFHDWYRKILVLEESNLMFLHPYIEYFDNKINVIENFNDYVKMFFLKSKIKHPENIFDENLVDIIYMFFENLISTYGPYTLAMFSGELKEYMGIVENEHNNRYDFCLKLIKNHPTLDVAMLILDIMCTQFVKNEEALLNKALLVLEEIKKISAPVIKIGINRRFRHLFSKCNCGSCKV